MKIKSSKNSKKWLPANRIRGKEVYFQDYSSTLGLIIGAEMYTASKLKHPNELRYGDMPKDFPVEALVEAASILNFWVSTHSSAVLPTT